MKEICIENRIFAFAMERKIFIVTGASGCIGAEVVRLLFQRGHYVIMACRNLEKGKRVADTIVGTSGDGETRVKLMELDLASFDSVRRFVGALSDARLLIDGLINNAGVLPRRFGLTPDGLESAVQINYIAPFLLVQLLLPLFEPNAAIVNVISAAKHPRKLTLQFFGINPNDYSQIGVYLRSKTALTVFSSSLADKMNGKIRVNVADPGIVNTDIIRLDRWFDPFVDVLFRPFIKKPAKGAIPIVNALFSAQTGMQYKGKIRKPISGKYTRHALNRWLWDETEKLIESKG